MKFLPYVAISALSAAVTVWLFMGGKILGPSRSEPPPVVDFSYSDFISFLLTVLAVILAALALGIGIIAFRTIAEIKREASQIARDHSKSEITRSLSEVPERVRRNVEDAVAELLPKAIDQAVEDAGKEGRLDQALERAVLRLSTGEHASPEPDTGSDPKTEREENDA